MSSFTHFRNQTGSLFSKVECQLACALVLYVRTRRHRRRPIDDSQPPTLQMLDEIMSEARWLIWDGAHDLGADCNPMPPNAHLNAYCLVRNLKNSPYHRRWFYEVEDRPHYWSQKANTMFDMWVSANSRLVHEYVLPPRYQLVYGVMAANHSSVYEGMAH